MHMPTIDQLNAPDVTVDMVRQYVVSTYPDAVMGPEQFVTEADLGNLRWLQQWWQPDKIEPEPTALASPLLSHFLIGYQFGHTMDAQMQRFYVRCHEYCREHGLDTYNPAIKAPVKKMFADPAERMAHARAHRKVRPREQAEEPVVNNEVAELELALAQLQAAHGEEMRAAKEAVKTHYEDMIRASAYRDSLKTKQAAEIIELRNQIKVTLAKQ
jgi:hypothetical protein